MLVLLFLVVPLAELYVIIQVAHAIGAFNTIGLLFLDSLLGGWLMKREGLGVMRRLQAKLQNGEVPGRELVDAFLIMLGGALMLAPGFITDILGMALLLPPVRAVIRAALARRFRTVAVNRGGFGDVIDLG
ncbi:MAG: protein FxsA [Actinomycetota bacterium]|nr:protein FxsA [Actinomycetota bacterium]